MAAGLTSGFVFNPTLCHSKPHPPPLSIPSLQSHTLVVRGLFSSPCVSVSNSSAAVSSASRGPITARYGGNRSPPSSRRPPQSQGSYDEALNMAGIRSDSVRLIDAQQNMVGVVSKNEAVRMAETAELDLVIVAPEADPPVVKIMDYNKYKYEQQRKKKEQQKKTNRMDMKELKMSYNIDSHDYSVRLRAAKKFMKDGDKVKVIVNLKGRENEFRNIAIELLKRFQNDVGELATEESKNFKERNVNIVLVPNKAILQKAPERPKGKDKTEGSEVPAAV